VCMKFKDWQWRRWILLFRRSRPWSIHSYFNPACAGVKLAARLGCDSKCRSKEVRLNWLKGACAVTFHLETLGCQYR